jgi:sulfonate transport system ATP-binding protein
MQDLLAAVQQEAGTTTILVTHDVDEAVILADRVLILRADATGAASVAATFEVAIPKPRDRGDPRVSALRNQLLRELGVPQRNGVTLRAAIEEKVKSR